MTEWPLVAALTGWALLLLRLRTHCSGIRGIPQPVGKPALLLLQQVLHTYIHVVSCKLYCVDLQMTAIYIMCYVVSTVNCVMLYAVCYVISVLCCVIYSMLCYIL